MSSLESNDDLTPAETKQLADLQEVVQRGVDTSIAVWSALADIRDRRLYRDGHETFEQYLQRRWGLSGHYGLIPALAGTRGKAAQPLEDGESATIHIRLILHRDGDAIAPRTATSEPVGAELLARLRWLMTKSGGTVAAISHQLETRAADLDEADRAQLRADLEALDDEVLMLKVLLVAPIDWDVEYGRLLAGELPPLADEGDAENED